MFVIAEVYPFLDGNGRIARIFMNAELDACGLCRIIIPTVYREDYLLALRKLSRLQIPLHTLKYFLRQEFTHSISFENYAASRSSCGQATLSWSQQRLNCDSDFKRCSVSPQRYEERLFVCGHTKPHLQKRNLNSGDSANIFC